MNHRLAIFFVFNILLLSHVAHANLSLSEYRLYFDARTKNNALVLSNTSNNDINFKVSLVHKDMTEEGNLVDVSEAEVIGRSAKPLLRFSPRRGTIRSQGMQAVRMTVRKKASLAAGEYRAVLKILTSVAKKTKNSGVGLQSQIAYSIPVIVRHGQLKVESKIINPQLITQNGQPTVMFWQTREGNRSLYGDFKVLNSDNTVVGEINSVGVYTPLSRRRIYIPITQEITGPLTIEYQENKRYGGRLLLTETMNTE
jgi:P pilus assembly chaperone PapD